jgi:hypothetical protein
MWATAGRVITCITCQPGRHSGTLTGHIRVDAHIRPSSVPQPLLGMSLRSHSESHWSYSIRSAAHHSNVYRLNLSLRHADSAEWWDFDASSASDGLIKVLISSVSTALRLSLTISSEVLMTEDHLGRASKPFHRLLRRDGNAVYFVAGYSQRREISHNAVLEHRRLNHHTLS